MSKNEELNVNRNFRNFDPSRKLKQTEIDFMKLIEQQNFERVKKLQRTRKNNILTGILYGQLHLKYLIDYFYF